MGTSGSFRGMPTMHTFNTCNLIRVVLKARDGGVKTVEGKDCFEL